MSISAKSHYRGSETGRRATAESSLNVYRNTGVYSPSGYLTELALECVHAALRDELEDLVVSYQHTQSYASSCLALPVVRQLATKEKSKKKKCRM